MFIWPDRMDQGQNNSQVQLRAGSWRSEMKYTENKTGQASRQYYRESESVNRRESNKERKEIADPDREILPAVYPLILPGANQTGPIRIRSELLQISITGMSIRWRIPALNLGQPPGSCGRD